MKPGGVLVYSTCTFSPLENEGVVETFLKRNRDFELIDCGVSFGRPSGLPEARRIFPMDGGEGHFIAKLRKNEESFESVECVEKAGIYQNNKLNQEIKASINNLLNSAFNKRYRKELFKASEKPPCFFQKACRSFPGLAC